MIQAIFTRDTTGWSKMQITGHAGSGEYGFDIICASVSVLAFNFVNSVEVMTKKVPRLDLADEGGYLVIEKPAANLTEDEEKIWQLLFSSVVIGIKQLAIDESQYVKQPIVNDNSTEEIQ